MVSRLNHFCGTPITKSGWADEYEYDNEIICYNYRNSQDVLYIIDEDDVMKLFECWTRHRQYVLHRSR